MNWEYVWRETKGKKSVCKIEHLYKTSSFASAFGKKPSLTTKVDKEVSGPWRSTLCSRMHLPCEIPLWMDTGKLAQTRTRENRLCSLKTNLVQDYTVSSPIIPHLRCILSYHSIFSRAMLSSQYIIPFNYSIVLFPLWFIILVQSQLISQTQINQNHARDIFILVSTFTNSPWTRLTSVSCLN